MNCKIYKFIFALIVVGLAGCSQENARQVISKNAKYSIYTMMKDGSEFILQTDSITSGAVNPAKQGIKVNPGRLFYDLIVRDGKYYRVDWKTNTFIKYQIENNKFAKKMELPLDGISSVENYNWISKDSLLIIGYDERKQKVRYAQIQVAEMKATQGEMEIPAPSGIYNSMSVGFSRFVNDALLIGYTYHTTNLNSYTTSDTIYLERLSYPGMKSLGRSKDTRSAYPAGPNTRQSHSFTDEKGDFYFIACPGIASGNNADKPTGIFRIKKSEKVIDPGYFFNISASKIQNHGYGFWYAGNGKAIVRTERKGVFKGMSDHWKVPHFDFYVIDLESKSTIRLDLPLDKGTARQCVLVEKGVVYITINSDVAGSCIWQYNPKTGVLKKGLKLDDKVDYVLRLERLN